MAEASDRDIADRGTIRFVLKEICRLGGRSTVDDIITGVRYQSIRSFGVDDLRDLLERHTNFFCQREMQAEGVAGRRRYSVVVARTGLQLCDEFCTEFGHCASSHCQGLHLCKFFLLSDSCRYWDKVLAVSNPKQVSCRYGHDLSDDHNQRLLRTHCLDQLSLSELRTLFCLSVNRSTVTVPSLCCYYNSKNGCKKLDYCGNQRSCPYLHICQYYIVSQCRYAKRCKRNHNIFEGQVKRILDRYGVNMERPATKILAELREYCSSVGSASSELSLLRSSATPSFSQISLLSKEERGEENAEICIYHFQKLGCIRRDRCLFYHCPLPYQWQHQLHSEWVDFPDKVNQNLEYSYSNPNETTCCIKNQSNNSNVTLVNFESMTGLDEEETWSYKIRRLSTASRTRFPKNKFSTQWVWYWKDEHGVWQRYHTAEEDHHSDDLTNEDVEKQYQNYLKGNVDITGAKINFEKMEQNFSEMSISEVIRRPLFISSYQIEQRELFAFASHK